MKVLVVGATGGMGYELTKELTNRGIQVAAFARTEGKLQQYFHENDLVSIFVGDGYKQKDILDAAAGADIIFHCASVPYPDWAEKHPLLAAHLLEAARTYRSKFVLVDNIYAYGRSRGQLITEKQPKNPHTTKGKIRLIVEEMVRQQGQKGTDWLIAHFPDFYGLHAENTYLDTTLKAIANGTPGIFIGSPDVPREYIYMPDAAKALANLALKESCYKQSWNIPAAGVITGREIIQIAQSQAGRRRFIIPVGKTMMKSAGLFSPFLREVAEMMYLTEDPVILCGDKYREEFGSVPATAYDKGIQFIIKEMMVQK